MHKFRRHLKLRFARSTITGGLGMALAVGLSGGLIQLPARAEFPKPSIYPISWELKFEHAAPRRIIVDVPGMSTPQAYWYLTYTVTNQSDKEQTFYPIFEMLAKDGSIIRSDKSIPAKVFDQIKTREKKQYLEGYPQIAGEIRLGEDQARDGVAIWQEPSSQMGQFTVFVGGLSGEIKQLTDDSGQPVNDPDGKANILRKTLQLDFLAAGDNAMSGQDAVQELHKDWIMR